MNNSFFKKNLLFLLFFIISTIFFGPVNATTVKKVVCLSAIRCNQANAGCSGKGGVGHRAKITIDSRATEKPPENTELRIFECLDTPDNGEVCTDANVNDNTKYLVNNYKYEFQGLFENDGTSVIYSATEENTGKVAPSYSSIKMAGNGTFLVGPTNKSVSSMEWQSYTRPAVTRRYKAYFTMEVANNTGAGGQQQGQPTANSGGQDCASVKWDPNGVIFDNKTLEPIPQANVSLYVQRKNETAFSLFNDPQDPTFANPYRKNDFPKGTLSDGFFQFFLPPYEDPSKPIYKLLVERQGYKPLTDTSTPVAYHANAEKIYSKPYPFVKQNDIAARDKWDIVEHEGTIETRNIPLESIDGIGKYFDLALIGYRYRLDLPTGEYVINATYSHPYTKVTPFTTTKDGQFKRNLPDVYADKTGKVEIRIKLRDLTADEIIGGVNGEKTILTGVLTTRKSYFNRFLTALNNEVQAQQSFSKTLKLDPIPTYLEGYAYAGSSVLPNTTVTILLKSISQPFYQTKTDEKGFYSISSDHLPSEPYVIVYGENSTKVGATTVTTSEFIQKNSKYLTDNKINTGNLIDDKGKPLIIATGKPTIKPSISSFGQPSGSNSVSGQAETGTTGYNNPQSSLILIIVVLLVLVLGVLAIVGVYIYRKNKQPPSSS